MPDGPGAGLVKKDSSLPIPFFCSSHDHPPSGYIQVVLQSLPVFGVSQAVHLAEGWSKHCNRHSPEIDCKRPHQITIVVVVSCVRLQACYLHIVQGTCRWNSTLSVARPCHPSG